MKSVKADDDDYYKYIQKGDKFDVSNLTAKTGRSGVISLGVGGSSNASLDALAAVYGSNPPTNLYEEIREIAQSGRTPIASLTLAGHITGSNIWGAAGQGSEPFLNLTALPEDTIPNGARAGAKIGPRRCWFTRTSTVRLVGCDSQTLAGAWAKAWLRPQAKALGTNSWLCGWVVTDPKSLHEPKEVLDRFITAQSRESCMAGGVPVPPQMRTPGEVEGNQRLWVTTRGKL